MHYIAVYFAMDDCHKLPMCGSSGVSSALRATMADGHMEFWVVVLLVLGGVPTVDSQATI